METTVYKSKVGGVGVYNLLIGNNPSRQTCISLTQSRLADP